MPYQKLFAGIKETSHLISSHRQNSMGMLAQENVISCDVHLKTAQKRRANKSLQMHAAYT